MYLLIKLLNCIGVVSWAARNYKKLIITHCMMGLDALPRSSIVTHAGDPCGDPPPASVPLWSLMQVVLSGEVGDFRGTFMFNITIY